MVCMDNLEFMKTLPSESIDLIYGDILFGTGKKFTDYQDLKPNRKVIEEFYIPRVEEMYRILKKTGSIYTQMDYRIVHWTRQILDDIFGYENFINEIIWHYSQGGKNKLGFGRKHDNILFYSKNIKKVHFNADNIRIPFTPHKQDKSNKSYGGKMGIDEDGRNYVEKWGTGNKKLYRYYLDVGKVPEDVWSDVNSIQSGCKERRGYDTQKPKALLERIIKASSNEGDIIADFFCGSGTSGVVAKELKRKYILCDINPKAIEITNSRLTS